MDKSSTLEEIKLHLRANYEDGCSCPACGQYVKLYRRKLGSPQSRALILLNSINQEKEWCHIREIVKQVNVHGDFAKMIYWGLIEEKLNTDHTKKTSGLWRITEKGKKFVKNELKIPSHALVYNGKCLGFSETQTDIVEALGKNFKYNELMGRG